MITTTPANDSYLHSGPLDTLASMTGGASYRAEVGAEAVFDRLGRELSGYYRIGVEKDATDADTRARRMKVQVSRSGGHRPRPGDFRRAQLRRSRLGGGASRTRSKRQSPRPPSACA